MNAPLTKTELRAAQTLADPRWATVQTRDKAANGTFVLGVRTTGIYCRPICTARQPRPENVLFFDTPADAEDAGFRACKRCRPNTTAPSHADAVAAACRTIETADEVPTLEALAGRAGLSPYHFHRVFKSTTGLTPHAFAVAHRAGRVRHRLGSSRTVTEAIYEAGFNSGSRFYEQANATLGMTPTAFRGGGRNEQIRFAIGQSSLGAVLGAATDKGVCAITLGDDPDALLRDLQDRFPHAELIGGDPAFETLFAKVVAWVEAPGTAVDLPLDIRGTAFQKRVWDALRALPAGETATYGTVAAQIGAPKAVRAVASACAANALAVAIPCHRVVRSTGEASGGGYRWGLARKTELLARERRS